MSLWTRWTDGKREAPEPLEGPVVTTVVIGTVLWFLLFVCQLPFYGWFADHGHEWWVWTCAAGAGLGLIGIWYVRGRDAAIRRSQAPPAPDDPRQQDGPDSQDGQSGRAGGAAREAAPPHSPDGHPAR